MLELLFKFFARIDICIKDVAYLATQYAKPARQPRINILNVIENVVRKILGKRRRTISSEKMLLMMQDNPTKWRIEHHTLRTLIVGLFKDAPFLHCYDVDASEVFLLLEKKILYIDHEGFVLLNDSTIKKSWQFDPELAYKYFLKKDPGRAEERTRRAMPFFYLYVFFG